MLLYSQQQLEVGMAAFELATASLLTPQVGPEVIGRSVTKECSLQNHTGARILGLLAGPFVIVILNSLVILLIDPLVIVVAITIVILILFIITVN